MKTTRRFLIQSGIGAVFWGGAAPAQTPAAPVNPRTLADTLPFLDWEPQTRGALIVIAPERAMRPGISFDAERGTATVQPGKQSDDTIRAGENGFLLAKIAPRYGRKIAVIGMVSAVVPETMATLRFKGLPYPDLSAGMRPESRTAFLLASLSPGQWKRALAENGIGKEDLSRDQKMLLAGVFPVGTVIRRQNPPQPGEEYGKSDTIRTDDSGDMRLRVYQDLEWDFSFQDPKKGSLTMGDVGGFTKPVYYFDNPQPISRGGFSGGFGGEPFAFGAMLMQDESNRPKPSDLDYAAPTLDRVIALDDMKTVGEMIARVREKTGVELYADGRYAPLSAYSRTAPGTGVRAGDLLKAVALSVTGTFRRVADGTDAAFVLTDDREGAGTRLVAINDWMVAAELELAAVTKTLREKSRAENLPANALWAIDPDRAPSVALRQKLGEKSTATGGQNNRFVPLADLPPGIQERVRYLQSRWRERRDDDHDNSWKPLREDGVNLRPRLKIAAVFPEIGAVPLISEMNMGGGRFGLDDESEYDYFGSGIGAWYGFGMIPPDPKAVLPVRVSAKRFEKRTVAFAVQSEADAVQAAKIAQKHDFSALLLTTGAADVPTVAAWVGAAKAAAPRLALWLQTPLLRRSDSEGMPLDRTIRGETSAQSRLRPLPPSPFPRFDERSKDTDSGGEYLAVGDPVATVTVRQHVAALVNVPNVAAVVFTGMIPPGYQGKSSRGMDFDPASELGYTPAMRLAFLRETGTDPIDLSPVGDLSQNFNNIRQRRTRLRLPFFPDFGPNVENMTIGNDKAITLGAKDAYPHWYRFRAKRLAALHYDVFKTAREHPNVSLYGLGEGAWRVLWEWKPEPAKSKNDAPKGNAPTPPGWATITYDPRTPPGVAPMPTGERFARQAARTLAPPPPPPARPRQADAAPPPRSVLFDLSQASLAEVDALLSQIVFEP